MEASSFYAPLGDGRFAATTATVGPWDKRLQHGSPPASLLARAIEHDLARDDARIARVSFDFYGPVPVGAVSVATEVLRAGVRIELAQATLTAGDRTAMVARAWRVAQTASVPSVVAAERPPPLPRQATKQLFVDVPTFGYGESLEWRFADGGFDRLGPATVYSRPRIPLLEGEEPSPLVRLLLMVDSANGVSAELSPSKFTFVPVELTVAVQRHPRTEWVGMRARTTIERDGVGLTRAELFDEAGFLGTATQTLFVAPRA
jgi:hypothetical protein